MTRPDIQVCPDCGEELSARARFCSACGARQPERAPGAPGGLWARPQPAPVEGRGAATPPAAVEGEPRAGGEAVTPAGGAGVAPGGEEAVARGGEEAAAPGGGPSVAPEVPPPSAAGRAAGELPPLPEVLRARLSSPAVVAPALAAAISAGIVLAAGLVIAVITPDDSIVGTAGRDASLLTEAFRQAVGTLLAPMVDPDLIVAGSRRFHPALLLAIPLAALIATTRRQLHRTQHMPPASRHVSAALAAVPFAVLMALFAAFGGSTASTRISVPVGTVFALGLLWGALGGLIGSVTALPPRFKVPAVARAALVAVRPLAIVLAVCTAVGVLGWLVQLARDVGDVRADRSTFTALVEEAAFAVEHGVNMTALAAGARFRPDALGALGLPFPVADANAVPGPDGAFRVFAYDAALSGFDLLIALPFLMGVLALCAVYAGFATARAMRATSLASGAAWGAITGPTWALAMAILLILAGGIFHGDADDASVFGIFLLGGAALGTLGGALAVGDPPRALSA
jgi:hypothetical protein